VAGCGRARSSARATGRPNQLILSRLTWRAVLAYVIGSIELDADDADFDDGLERVLRGTISA
jgi:hypothetical protein